MCLEQKENLCIESGISCHDCDKKWVGEGNSKTKCSVCVKMTQILIVMWMI